MRNYFELLDVPVNYFMERKTLDKNYFDLCRRLHPDSLMHASPDEQAEALLMISDVNLAYKILKKDETRLAHIFQIAGLLDENEGNISSVALAPEFLMEMLEYNERAEEASQVAGLKKEIEALDSERKKSLEALLQTPPDIVSILEMPERLQDALRIYLERKYLLRLIEQFANIAS